MFSGLKTDLSSQGDAAGSHLSRHLLSPHVRISLHLCTCILLSLGLYPVEIFWDTPCHSIRLV